MTETIKLFFLGAWLRFLYLLKLNKNEFWRKRMEICKGCPIYKNGICSSNFHIVKTVGNSWYVCSDKDYLNKSYLPYENMRQGCGCVCVLKTQIKEERCPANFW